MSGKKSRLSNLVIRIARTNILLGIISWNFLIRAGKAPYLLFLALSGLHVQ